MAYLEKEANSICHERYQISTKFQRLHENIGVDSSIFDLGDIEKTGFAA